MSADPPPVRIMPAATDVHVEGISAAFQVWKPDYWTPIRDIRDAMDDPEQTVLVAENHSGQVIGLAMIRHQRGGWPHIQERPGEDDLDIASFLRWIYVDPSHRNLGIGSQLMAAVISACQAADSVMIAVVPDESDLEPSSNGEASDGYHVRASLFQRHGFRPATPSPDEVADPWLMVRSLAL